jgi:hypothetical protein
MSFKSYVLSRQVTNDPIGTFISDVKFDRDFPDDITSLRALQFYLCTRNACPEAVEAAHQVWRQYCDMPGATRTLAREIDQP